MKQLAYLREIEELFASEQLTDQFEYGSEEQRYEILDFLEKLIELGEASDVLASKLLLKNILPGLGAAGR